MKKIFLIACSVLVATAGMAQTKRKAPAKKTVVRKVPVAPVFKNNLDSASYAFGLMMGNNLKQNGLNTLNYSLLNQALRDVFAGKKGALEQTTAQNAISKVFENAIRKKFEPAIKEGEAFFAKNKTNPKIKTTPSGLQYEVITPGNGPKPLATDTVLVHYRGTLANGQPFDSSYDRNEPFSTSLKNVIAGWTEGVQLMPTGSKYKFYIPYKLGYGSRGAGADIPPYSTLVFEIELLKINNKN